MSGGFFFFNLMCLKMQQKKMEMSLMKGVDPMCNGSDDDDNV